MQENINLKDIPQELKLNGLWCGWRLTEKGKVPFNLSTGEHARSNDETTFSSYPVLLNNIHKYLKFNGNKQVGGIGLGIFRGYSAIDIDHCVNEDGTISEMARDIIDFCNSYTEFSPSGTGIRIIFKTQVKIDKEEYYINNHNRGLEIYISDNTNKFVTITGNRISGSEINEIDITDILNKYMRKGEFNINRVLEKDDKLRMLWNKTAPGSHADESESDMALACKLSYYLKGDENLIKQYFEQSPYFRSKDEEHIAKWNRGYGADTIKKATHYIGPVNSSQLKSDFKQYNYNDTGNAHRFIDQFRSDVRYNIDNKIWMIWNGNYWQYDVTNDVKNYVEILAEKMLLESTTINDMEERMRYLKNLNHIYSSNGKEALLKEARHITGIPILNSDLDRDKYLICCQSKTIDLRSREIRDNHREDYISKTTNYDIDIEHEPVLFKQFLQEIFVDPEVVHYVHKALGYSISDLTSEQCMFILKGDGNNGKSLLLDVINTILGEYSITCKPQLLTETNYATQNFEEIARLKGKRFCVVEEINSGDKLNEQLVKQFTSGIGKVVARFLYSGSFEFEVRCKIWMATNYDPVIRGVDKGIWRRLVKIPVPTDFTGREDKHLREKLLAEGPQILNWLLEGYKLYEAEGLEMPQAIKDATNEYKKEMDIVQQWLEEYCEQKPIFFEKANTLYENFRNFCIKRDLKTNQTVFGRNLGKKFKKYNSGKGIVYIGVRLKTLDNDDLSKRVEYERIKVDENV